MAEVHCCPDGQSPVDRSLPFPNQQPAPSKQRAAGREEGGERGGVDLTCSKEGARPERPASKLPSTFRWPARLPPSHPPPPPPLSAHLAMARRAGGRKKKPNRGGAPHYEMGTRRGTPGVNVLGFQASRQQRRAKDKKLALASKLSGHLAI